MNQLKMKLLIISSYSVWPSLIPVQILKDQMSYHLLKAGNKVYKNMTRSGYPKHSSSFSNKGKPILDTSETTKMWWYPPQPSLVLDKPPKVDSYFTRKLFLWMPRKLWQVRLVCPQEEC